jgi:hypothetical protein
LNFLTRSGEKVVTRSLADVGRISRHHDRRIWVRVVTRYVAGIVILSYFLHQL